jgi:putative peptidoglycan lipid II flippase
MGKGELRWKDVPLKFPWSRDLKKVCKLMGPMVIAGSAGQINVLVNTNFATSLQEGAVTWLNFSFRILQLPIGVFAVGVGIISLPSLTKVISRKGSRSEVAAKLQEALSLVSWLVIPCFCFILLNAMPVTRLLYEHGKFTSNDASATSEALFYYSFSLIAYGFLKVLTSYYYATERTRFAMHVSLFSILVNLAANLFFVTSLGHKCLALSTSCTLIMNAAFLFWGLRKDSLKWQIGKFWKSFFLITVSFVSAFAAQYFVTPFLESASFMSDFGMKWRACFTIGSNGLIVGIIFAIFWLADSKLKLGSR